jgi:hypothetical protein
MLDVDSAEIVRILEWRCWQRPGVARDSPSNVNQCAAFFSAMIFLTLKDVILKRLPDPKSANSITRKMGRRGSRPSLN